MPHSSTKLAKQAALKDIIEECQPKIKSYFINGKRHVDVLTVSQNFLVMPPNKFKEHLISLCDYYIE